MSEVNCWCFVIHVTVAGAQTLQIFCGFHVSSHRHNAPLVTSNDEHYLCKCN